MSEDAPWSSKHIIDMLCPPLEESGNPVVCYPVAGYALGVKAKWEPMQEGSGTPYPAGGGKNQLNPAGYEAATKTINGITFTRLNTGEVVVNGTATGTAIYVLIANFSYPVSLSTNRNWSIAGENVISAQGLVSGVQIAYKLEKPMPFTVTGAQPIPALAGVNTVLTDADSATVTGRADPIKRITDLEAAVASIN